MNSSTQKIIRASSRNNANAKLDCRSEHRGTYNYYRVVGTYSYSGFIKLIQYVIEQSEIDGVKNILLYFEKLDEYNMSNYDKFKIGFEVVRKIGRKFKLAVVIPDEDENDRDIENILVNRMVKARKFMSVEEAIKWLTP